MLCTRGAHTWNLCSSVFPTQAAQRAYGTLRAVACVFFSLCGMLTIGRSASAVEDFQVVRFTENPVLMECKLFSSAKLTFTGITGEAGEVVDVFPRFPDPIRSGNTPAALGTFGAKTSVKKEIR